MFHVVWDYLNRRRRLGMLLLGASIVSLALSARPFVVHELASRTRNWSMVAMIDSVTESPAYASAWFTCFFGGLAAMCVGVWPRIQGLLVFFRKWMVPP